MATVVQTQNAAGPGGLTQNFGSAVSVGSSVVVWVGDYNTSGAAISSSTAPTYNGASVTGATKLLEVQSTTSGTSNIMYFAIWLLPNVQSSGTSVTITAPTNGLHDVNSHFYIAEVSGLGASPAADSASSNPKTAFGDAGGVLTSGATGNAVGSSGIVLGGMMQDGQNSGWTGPAGWTTITTGSSYVGASYQVFTSSGSSYTWTPSSPAAGQWATGAVILDAGTPALVSPPNQQQAAWILLRRRTQPQLPLPPAVTAVVLADSGVSSDALAASAAAPLTDAGAGSDALAVSAAAPLTDAGTGSDALTVSTAAPLPDTGAGSDALTASAAALLTDAGAGTDALAAGVAAPLADAGAGTDALSVSAAAALPDSGAGTDALAAAQPVALTDSGTGTDTLSVTVQAALPDSGSGSDAVAAAAAVQLADAGTGTDAITAASSSSPALADSGTGTDTLSVTALAALPEAGAGADALAVVSGILKTDTDSCTASESGFAFITSSEAGTASDGGELILVRDTDRCAMAERELTRWPHDTDRCAAVERGWQSGPVQGGTDTCTASDGRELITLASADACQAADTAPDIEVYTYVPPFRTGPGGGWYKVAWGDTEVLRVPRADGAVLRFAAALARAREVRVVADADCCTAAEASRPVTGVTISVVPALEVAIVVSSDIPAFR